MNIHTFESFFPSSKMTNIKVECYSGYKADEKPLSFSIDDKKFMIEKIIDQWRTPDSECFKILADDGGEYILKHDVRNDKWDLY